MKVLVEFSNQFMMKSKDRDMPRMLPFQKLSAEVEIDKFDRELEPYVQTYLANQKAIADAEQTGETPAVTPYNPPRELVKKWRQKVRKQMRTHNPDVKDLFKLPDDDVIEQAIILGVDYALDDIINERKQDELLAAAGIAIPNDTDTEYLAAKIFHVIGWKPV